MTRLSEIMKPYLTGTILADAEYEDYGEAQLQITLPKMNTTDRGGAGMAYRKTQKLVFDQDVVDAVMQDQETPDKLVTERVGNYICNVLEKKFREWGEKNVQLTFTVGSEALDEW